MSTDNTTTDVTTPGTTHVTVNDDGTRDLTITAADGTSVTVTGTDDDLQTMLGTARVQVADNKRVYGEAKAGTRMVKVLVSETVDYTQYIDPAAFPDDYDLDEDQQGLLSAAVADACGYFIGLTRISERYIDVQ
jgi:hypothetical protein